MNYITYRIQVRILVCFYYNTFGGSWIFLEHISYNLNFCNYHAHYHEVDVHYHLRSSFAKVKRPTGGVSVSCVLRWVFWISRIPIENELVALDDALQKQVGQLELVTHRPRGKVVLMVLFCFPVWVLIQTLQTCQSFKVLKLSIGQVLWKTNPKTVEVKQSQMPESPSLHKFENTKSLQRDPFGQSWLVITCHLDELWSA